MEVQINDPLNKISNCMDHEQVQDEADVHK